MDEEKEKVKNEGKMWDYDSGDDDEVTCSRVIRTKRRTRQLVGSGRVASYFYQTPDF